MYVTSGKICDGQCRNEAFKYGSVSEWTPSEDFFFFFWLIRFLFWKSNMDSVRISCLDRQWSFLESWACSWSNSTVVVEANRKKKKKPFTMCDRCTVMNAKCGEKWAQHTALGVSISKCDLLLVAGFYIMKKTTSFFILFYRTFCKRGINNVQNVSWKCFHSKSN